LPTARLSVGSNEHVVAMNSRRIAVVRTVMLDIVGPLIVYRVCRQGGVPIVWALVLSGSVPGLGVLVDWLRFRTLELVGVFVVGGIALAIVLALIGGNPKVLLLDGAATTTAIGIACLVSLGRRRPLIFYFAQAFSGGRHSVAGQEMDEEYIQYEAARSFWRTVTVVWCTTYFLEATGTVILVQTAPRADALVFNRVTPTLASAVLIVWTTWWGNRLRAEKPTGEPPDGEPSHQV
jgi:hypothetical protein